MEILNNRAIEFYRNDPKLLSKEELEKSIESCKLVFDSEVIEYLNDLLNLKTTALDDPLKKFENYNLTYFTVYKRLLIYNIINSLKAIVDDDIVLSTHKNRSVLKHKDSNRVIFEMDYNGVYHYFINLYTVTLANKKFLESETNRYLKLIDILNSSEHFDRALANYVRQKDYYEIKKASNDEEIVRNKIEEEILYCQRRILTLQKMAVRFYSYQDRELVETMTYYNYLVTEALGLPFDDMYFQSNEFEDPDTLMVARTFKLDRPVVKVKTMVGII